jgi:hypothetical protein
MPETVRFDTACSLTDEQKRKIRQLCNLTSEGLELVLLQFELERATDDTIPRPDCMSSADLFLVGHIGAKNGLSWGDFKRSQQLALQAVSDASNIFLPIYHSKTDSSPNGWVYDCGTLTPTFLVLLTEHIRQRCPSIETDEVLGDLLRSPPDSNADYMAQTVDAIGRLADLFVSPIGEDVDRDFAWQPSLAMLAGLGLDAVRRFARSPAVEGFDSWQFWASCSDHELVRDIVEARRVSGFPVGLFRCNLRFLLRDLSKEVVTAHGGGGSWTPRWVRALVALHIVKYTRFDDNMGGAPRLTVMCEGNSAVIPCNEDNVNSFILSSSNQHIARDMCKVLGLPCSTGKNDSSWIDELVLSILKKIKPMDLARRVGLDRRPLLLASPCITTTRMVSSWSSDPWVNPRLGLVGAASISPVSGRVHTETIVGSEALAYKWPLGLLDEGQLALWRNSLPERVQPEPASQVLLRTIRNINPLGHIRGLELLVDTIVSAAILRPQLFDSKCSCVQQEFPLVYALPYESEIDQVTNQGKTLLCRTLGGAVLPGIKVTMMTPNSGAPAQRSLAENIWLDGSTILDEFNKPPTHDHFLAQAGMQTLATGGSVPVGRATENAKPLKLSAPLFINAKIPPDVPDLMNRAAPIFLNALSDATRATDAQLEEIMSGKTSLVIRASHVCWMEQTKLLERVREATLCGGWWRFNAHLTIATEIAKLRGYSLNDLQEYLRVAADFCARQVVACSESGLAESIGAVPGFDLGYYWYECREQNLAALAARCKAEGSLSIQECVREIVQDGDRRRIEAEMKNAHTNERAMSRLITKTLKRSPMTRGDGFTLTLVEGAKDSKGRARNMVLVARTTVSAEEQLLSELPPPLPV